MKEQIVLAFEQSDQPQEQIEHENIRNYILEQLEELSKTHKQVTYEVIETEEEKVFGGWWEVALTYLLEHPEILISAGTLLIKISLKIKEKIGEKSVVKVKSRDKELHLPATETEIKQFLDIEEAKPKTAKEQSND